MGALSSKATASPTPHASFRSPNALTRAALGLSEETDAPIVIVSEETGSISYAYKGQLVRGISVEELRAFLTSVIVRASRAPGLLNWIRSRLGDRYEHQPGTTFINRADVPRNPNGGGK
jgi:hypothetical protein